MSTATLSQPTMQGAFTPSRASFTENQAVRQKAYICSVHWREKSAEKYHSNTMVNGVPIPNGLIRYHIPACARNEYQIIEVSSAFTFRREIDEESGEPRITQLLHRANEIAADLITEWAAPIAGVDVSPSIRIMNLGDYTMKHGDNGELRPVPTAAFLQSMIANQEKLARFLVDQGSQYHDKNPMTVTPQHRAAVRYLYGEEGHRHYTWAKTTSYRTTKDCYACGAEILLKALVCSHCHTNLAEFCRSEMITPHEYDEAVRSHTEVRYSRKTKDNIERLIAAVKAEHPNALKPGSTKSERHAFQVAMAKAVAEGKRLNTEADAAAEEYHGASVPDPETLG